jgi:DNA mismatch repair protein MutS2
LNVQGTVRSLPDQGDEAEVLIGDVRLRIDAGRLSPAEAPEPEGVESAISEIGLDLGPVMSTVELDLRGMRADEALISVEEFLDKALRDGLSSVRIIHGKGTGVLRQAVRDLLEHHPLAKSFQAEAPDRGGSGATAVELV